MRYTSGVYKASQISQINVTHWIYNKIEKMNKDNVRHISNKYIKYNNK